MLRIVDVRTVLLTGPCTGDPWLLPFKKLRSAAFIEIHTSAGVVGVGETYAGYFFPEAVPLVVDYLKPILVDADTTDVRTLCGRMRLCCAYWGRTGLGAAVIAGIEAALWDVQGQLAGVPVVDLLGGARHESLPTYATGGPSPWPIARLLDKVDYYLGLGFRAVKLSSGYIDMVSREEVGAGRPAEAIVDMEAEKAAVLRRHVGDDVEILLDGHMGHREGSDRWHVSLAARVMAALAAHGIFLFEEPLPYSDLPGYTALSANSPIPIAGGEQLSTVEEFALCADQRAFSVAQPDAAWVGISGFAETARLFAQRGCGVAPHAWGAGGAVMQNVHAAFAAANTVIVEIPPAAGPLHREVWGDSLEVRDGRVFPPQAPGLGIRLTEQIKERFPFVPGAEEFSSVPGKVMRS